jgi:two-component system chemotaxis response regulator CheY
MHMDATNQQQQGLNATILVVDDSSVTRAAIRRTLTLAGLPAGRILEAGNGKDALTILDHVKVDVILADLQMPEMDGVEMTKRVLANPKHAGTSVMIVSADPNAERIEALKQDGVRGYVKKPFTPEQIRDGIRQVLSQQQKRAA